MFPARFGPWKREEEDLASDTPLKQCLAGR